MVYVVGVGPGSGLYLTRAAEEIIDKAQLLIGGTRNIEFIRTSLGLKEGQDTLVLGSDLASMMDQIEKFGQGYSGPGIGRPIYLWYS